MNNQWCSSQSLNLILVSKLISQVDKENFLLIKSIISMGSRMSSNEPGMSTPSNSARSWGISFMSFSHPKMTWGTSSREARRTLTTTCFCWFHGRPHLRTVTQFSDLLTFGSISESFPTMLVVNLRFTLYWILTTHTVCETKNPISIYWWWTK